MTDNTGMLSFPTPDEDDVLAAQIAAMYAATPTADAGTAERVARAVLADAMHTSSRTAFGVLRPRWWWGAVAATLLVTVTMRPWRAIGRVVGTSTSTNVSTNVSANALSDGATLAQPSGMVTVLSGGDEVRFDLKLPAKAREVAIVGDFNGWDEKATPMLRRNADNSWSAQVPLTPGRHVYAFVVDGTRWLVDPLAPQVPDSGFGPSNAVMVEGATQ